MYYEYLDNDENTKNDNIFKDNDNKGYLSFNDTLLENEKLTDNDLINIYNFYIYKGYFNIISIQIINIIKSIFLYFLILFIFLCIDYNGLINIKNEEKNISDYLNFEKLANTNFIYIMCMITVSINTLIKLNNTIVDSIKYLKVKKFFQEKLNIDKNLINTITWKEIINILNNEYGKEYNCYNINSRILRKDNILIDIYNTKLNNLLCSSLMEWNIYYCLFSIIFNENGKINDKIFKNPYQIKKSIKTNILIVLLLTIIFMPFIILYMLFFCVLKYGPNFYNHPSKISSRQWSLKSRWKLRYYNELKHELDKRLYISSYYAKHISSEHKVKVIDNLVKLVVFLASSFFMILLFLSVLNENILFHLNITQNKPVIWYMGILGTIIALGKNFIRETKKEIVDNNYHKLLNKIKLISIKNGNTLEDKKIKKNILKYYEYQIYTLIKECLSVLFIPFLLYNLFKDIDNIIDNIINSLEFDTNLGYISKNSNFININEKTTRETLLSFYEFRNNYNWGENIQNFLIDSKLFDEIGSTNIEENNSFDEKYIIESQLSVI